MTRPAWLKLRWRSVFAGAAVALAIAALGFGAWYWLAPRTIDVCVVSDYSFRQQHPDWHALLKSRFRAVQAVFSGSGVRWRFLQAEDPDPTGNFHDMELRRRRLARADCKADIILGVTGQPEGGESGNVVPFAHTAIVVDSLRLPEERNVLRLSEERSVQVMAHGLAAMFGVPTDSAGAGTLMTVPPESSTIGSAGRKRIHSLRRYDFRAGTQALESQWTGRVLGALQDAYAGKPGSPVAAAHRTIGLALAADENYKPAAVHLREVARLDAENPQAHEELGAALLHDADYPAAIAEYREAVRLRPSSPELRAALATALANGGQGDAAIDEYTAALGLRPGFAMAQAAMAYVLSQHLGRIDDAIGAYRKALEMSPGLPQAAEGLERAVAIKAAATEVIPERRKQVLETPANAMAHFDLALSEARAGNVENAIQEFHKTIALDPRNDRAHSNLALLLYVRGDYAGAQREAQAAKDAGGSPPPDLLDAVKRKGGR
jgi:Flp pilus assembly protein TadD